MSNFVYGKIFIKDYIRLIESKIDFSMVEYCINHNFALKFIDRPHTSKETNNVSFKISDNFFVNYCERFLEPIIYTPNGEPITQRLCKDLDKMQGLVNKVFEFDFVERIELRFSYIEVDEEDYEICVTNPIEMKNVILEKYLSELGFPVINVVVKK